MLIGQTLKILRQQRGLTLRKVADATGLSIGYLSNLERDINSPTITSLNKISNALGTNIVSLLQHNETGCNRVVRKDARVNLLVDKKSRIVYQLLAERDRSLKPVCITVEPAGEYAEVPLGHVGDEFGLILEGTMEIIVNGEMYLLAEGDSIYIESYVPHKYRNTGSARCVSLWVVQGTSSDVQNED